MSISKKLKQKFVLSALGIVLSCFIALSSQPVGAMTGYAADINVNDLSSLSNQERANAGLAPLSLNSQLNSAALAKANDMFADNYWAHVAPDGVTPWSFMISAGYKYTSAGENLAKEYNTSSGVVSGWMGSPSHKVNVLSSSYVDVGYAVVNGNLLGSDTTLVVAMYGAKSAPVAATTKPSSTPAAPATTTTKQTKAVAPVAVSAEEKVAASPVAAEQTVEKVKVEVVSAIKEKTPVNQQEQHYMSALIYNIYTSMINFYVFLKYNKSIILGLILAAIAILIGIDSINGKNKRRHIAHI